MASSVDEIAWRFVQTEEDDACDAHENSLSRIFSFIHERGEGLTMMPKVMNKYRQPWFSARGQSPGAPPGHEKLSISGQATRLPTSCPNAHQMERMVRRY